MEVAVAREELLEEGVGTVGTVGTEGTEGTVGTVGEQLAVGVGAAVGVAAPGTVTPRCRQRP